MFWQKHFEFKVSFDSYGEYAFGRAKNKYFKLKFRKKLLLYCFLFDNNRSFRSKVMVENVTARIEISYYIMYFVVFSSCDI